MKIKAVYESFDNGCGNSIEIFIDDKRVFCACDGEPEDNTLNRNFNDCLKITCLLKQAYEAGQRGETFEIE